MAETQFKEQGGTSTMDPSAPLRWFSSRFMCRMANLSLRDRRRAKTEAARQKAGEPHRIEYFHQVEDAYSHLSVQLLAPLAERYDVEIVCHLTRGPAGKNAPEPELLLDLARRDSLAIASHYGLRFPTSDSPLEEDQIRVARRVLAAAPADELAIRAIAVGEALFSGDRERMAELANTVGMASLEATGERLDQGSKRRTELGHYSGAMFFYGGEWYWGVDRFYHLESRLAALGARSVAGKIAPRPAIEKGPKRDSGSLTLEFYPSLRSPYTSIIYDETLSLAEATGVNLVMRPVLPMVMRGVPATREKGRYILSDTAREAAALGLEWGDIYDPIGQPVRDAYSLYPWAVEQGRGNELLGAFLKAAFRDGVNTNNDRGLRHVVEAAGLSWADAENHLGDPAWEALIETNRLAMYEFGCWGVPSYRLLDANGQTVLALWGQDRLWLVSREIQRLLAAEG